MQIGELLVAAGLVSQADIDRAVDRQHDAGGRLGPSLVAIGAISAEELAHFVDGVPVEPATVPETGLPETFLIDLMLKFLFIGPAETTAELSAALRLPPGLVTELLEAAVRGQLVAALGSIGGALGMRYELTDTGKTRAREALSRSAYMGPAPVPLEVYAHWLERQKVTNEIIDVVSMRRAFDGLEVADALVDKLGPAITSGRALLMYGPPGNGKTSVAQRLDRVFRHVIHIPHAVLVEGQVMTVFDPDVHVPVDRDAGAARPRLVATLYRDEADGRFVPCRRPFIVTGGELTLEMLDLKHEAGGNFYAAPLHMKAAGGCLLIDDFGRQMVSPTALLNRWIVPLENRVDYLKLATGKSFRVPFQTVVIFSTNLAPADLMDPAFLRRIPYKLEIGPPSPEAWRRIFKAVATTHGIDAEDSQIRAIEHDLTVVHGLDLAAYQPRFLIEQIVAASRFKAQPAALHRELVALALDNLTVGRSPGGAGDGIGSGSLARVA